MGSESDSAVESDSEEPEVDGWSGDERPARRTRRGGSRVAARRRGGQDGGSTSGEEHEVEEEDEESDGEVNATVARRPPPLDWLTRTEPQPHEYVPQVRLLQPRRDTWLAPPPSGAGRGGIAPPASLTLFNPL